MISIEASSTLKLSVQNVKIAEGFERNEGIQDEK